nr:immunoglobulin heavy chain junction region [Macaca mulatta]MOX37831.1 immunoglobulin heavy chain junction region [Macaca mulatta]MOX38105.1 immunoglobulin heavy chain junction region [Macaca mulatta]MOX38384.1 immunoglobulin heavy chain junction region [Macaca mulatta]MOX38431.1 immunoglobulin heavy chain junction region [Macaca mulatta]
CLKTVGTWAHGLDSW